MPTAHPMLPDANHDEAAEQLFIRDFKGYLGETVEPFHRALAVALDPGEQSNARVETTFERLHEQDSFRAWASLRRASQEQLWDVVGTSVARQRDVLRQKASAAPAIGSVTLDPEFRAPAHLAHTDVHLMPGGYTVDDGDGDLSQGALMDRGGAVYMLGRNGGLMNDVRGHTMVSHLMTRWPDFMPASILELGCGIGASIVPVAGYFPEAEIHAIDVGPSMLRYAGARAAWVGADVAFRLGDAAAAPFPDAGFDLVFSSVLLHETTPEMIPAIMAESFRLLAPGGVVIHLEVPQRYEAMDLWGKIRGEVERIYNNEPCWREAISGDYAALLAAAGFEEVAIGYQSATGHAERGKGAFSDQSQGVFRSWFVASGRKPV